MNTPDTGWEKEFDGRMTSFSRYGGFYHGNKSGVELYDFNNIKAFIKELLSSRDTYWKEQIKKTKDEWYEVGYREGGDSKRIDIEILKEDWKERVVDSKRFFIAVEEDNITIRPVVRSDLDQILDNLK